MAEAAVPLAVAAVGAGVTLYEGQQTRKAAPKPPQLPDIPKLPDTHSLATSLAQGETEARSAGGTILSDQSKNRGVVGGIQNTGQRTLLGS